MYQRLVKRMTRFWVETNFERTQIFLQGVIAGLGYSLTKKARGVYHISTKDSRGANLVLRCTFIQVEQRILLDFRLSRGCGLEFKKHFAKIKVNCSSIVDKAPILWTDLLPVKSVPGVPN